MTDFSEQKKQSLRILQLLCNQIVQEDPCRSKLLSVIHKIRNNDTPYPLKKNDWISLCNNVGINCSSLHYRKLIAHFSPEEKKYYETIKKKKMRLLSK